MTAPIRRPAALLFALAAGIAGGMGLDFPLPRGVPRRPPEPSPVPSPAASNTVHEEGPPCPVHDADGRRCQLGRSHYLWSRSTNVPWGSHWHIDGWKPVPESRQVRRARERANAKSKKRSGR